MYPMPFSLEVGILKPMKRPVLGEEPTKQNEEKRNSRKIDRRVCKLLIQELRMLINDVAEKLCLDLDIREYPVNYDPHKRFIIKNFASAIEICEKDMTVVVDPPDQGISFAAATTKNPIRRLLAAFSEKDEFEERFDVLGTQKLPLVTTPDDEYEIEMLPKAFSLYIPPNIDDAARLYQHNRSIVEEALAYPFGLHVKKSKKRYFELN